MTKSTIQSVGSIVTLPSIAVMGKAVVGVKNSEKAFHEIELKLTTMRGRKFYGLLHDDPETGKYFACVQVNPGDNPKALGLEARQTPGGRYVRRKIRYWYEDISIIGKGFGLLFEKYPHDPSRPTIEYYRSDRDVHIFVPVVTTSAV